MASPASPSAESRRQGIAVRGALLALDFYKAHLSWLMAGSCKFEPTCSRYMYEAIERFGILRGVWLGTRRLLLCQPFSRKYGFDPVPEKWEVMNVNAELAGSTRGERS